MIISLIRTVILYISIIAAIRVMGKRQINELQPSELVITFLISNIASIPMQNTGQPLISGLIPIMALIAFELISSVLMIKSNTFRKFMCGTPIVIINDGKIDQKQMSSLRMTIEDLTEQLRQLNVFSIHDVAYAIIETNGKMSVIKKPEKQQPDLSMMNIHIPDNGIETVVISDGHLAHYSLSLCNLSHEWVDQVLAENKLSIKDVFIMTANKNKDFKIIKKQALEKVSLN